MPTTTPSRSFPDRRRRCAHARAPTTRRSGRSSGWPRSTTTPRARSAARNTIFCFTVDGLRFCDFGDFGQAALRGPQQAAIGAVDVLLLPVGGGPTVGGERAAAIVRALRPRLVVPMHYRTEAISFLETPEAFLTALAARAEHLPASGFEVEPLLGSREAPIVALPAAPR
jgi:L-ascorbate metabolism protein UlaG (beta-lactamase superfamily)